MGKKKSQRQFEYNLVKFIAVTLVTVVISAMQENAANRVHENINRNRDRRRHQYIPFEEL